ncbi:MAG: ribulose-phosphate 3-epimerase [Mycoplasma sp.]|nr:ribulose-phosphate 3-epimerase [Mycoplasma sp.]
MLDRQITPSILNVSKQDRPKIVNKLINLGIKWFHYDVMDEKFVSNTGISIEEIISIKNNCKKHLSDVHLMVENPFEYATQLSDHVTCLTVHFESFKSESELVKFVDQFSHTNWVGLAINPETDFSKIRHILYLFDLVLIMSVNPGFGGQKFIEKIYKKIVEIKEFIDEEKLPTIIQVDGGINDENSKKIFSLGSSFNVVGTYLINNIDDLNVLKKLGKL